jgi:hypothetical protein
MSTTDDLEFELTRRRARQEGFYLNRHLDYDPAQGGGDLYLMPERTRENPRPLSLLSYATSAEVHAYLNQVLARRLNLKRTMTMDSDRRTG